MVPEWQRPSVSRTNRLNDITVTEHADTTLLEMLSDNFDITIIPVSEKQRFIDNLEEEKKGILLDQAKEVLHIYAYKETRAIGKLEAHLNEYHSQREMQRIGLHPE